jgi:hypothetical protein
MTDQNPICLMHIGKTGGSFLRSIIRHNVDVGTSDLRLLKHQGNLRSSARHHGATRKLAFVIRDPETRFLSGFYSRLRQGRPTYDFPWSGEEATAFSFFATANDLAEGLDSMDERLKSAARFAMGAIQHLHLNYQYYFESVEALLAERSKIMVCIDLPRLNKNLDEVMSRLGFDDYQMPHRPVLHASPTPPPALSDAGKAALREFWAEEWVLYDAALQLAQDQFPD